MNYIYNNILLIPKNENLQELKLISNRNYTKFK